jgi:hypothetical protein
MFSRRIGMASDGDGGCTRHGCDMGTALIVKHQLTAKDYSLEGPFEFARPPLTQKHKLKVKSYATKPPTVSTKAGRHPKISATTKKKLIAALIRWLRRWRTKNPNRPIFQTTPATKNELRRLANKAGLTAVSDYTLQRQIASPAFRMWKKSESSLATRKRKGKN